MGFCTVPEKITQQMINGRELDILGTRMSLNQWIPTSEKMAAGQYRMEGLATTFVKFSEIDKVFENILHPDPSVKKTVILFDGAEDRSPFPAQSGHIKSPIRRAPVKPGPRMGLFLLFSPLSRAAASPARDSMESRRSAARSPRPCSP